MPSKFLLVVFLFTMTALHCDRGLSPTEPGTASSGISGTVYFSNWPPPDSLFDIRIILFQDYPPASIVDDILSGKAIVYPAGLNDTLPRYMDSLNYQFAAPPGNYGFLTVAEQYGPNFYQDWQIAGFYDTTPQDTLPTPVVIPAGEILTGIRIFVNFDSIP